MREHLPKNAALILIDMQQGFREPTWGTRNNLGMEAHVESLLWVWRWTHRPIFHVQHCSQHDASPLHVSRPGHALMAQFRPLKGEPLIKKRVNSAFIGTDLKARLRNSHIDTIVVAGLTTNHCVSTTVRMAGNFGFNTYLLKDGTAAFSQTGVDGVAFDAETIHQTTLANLHEEFATVTDVESIYSMALTHEKRQRASLVIVCDGRILLMHRHKQGREYYTVPGGGVERGETLEQAAIREAKEETGLDVTINRYLWTYAEKNHHFLVTDFCGDLSILGPELARITPNNRYALEWVDIDRLATLSLSPAPVGERILATLRNQ